DHQPAAARRRDGLRALARQTFHRAIAERRGQAAAGTVEVHAQYGEMVIMLATLWRGAGMSKFCSVLIVAVGLGLSGCVKTSMQGYADRDLPSRTIQHLAVYVAAPGPLASSMQSSVAEEARKRGVMADDALTILPPTRTYTDAEIRKALAERGVDGVLLITVADSGVQTQYAGTIFQSSYNGMSSVDGTITRMSALVQKRTNAATVGMSAKCQEETSMRWSRPMIMIYQRYLMPART